MRKKKGTSHRHFKYHGFYKVITLMESEILKYQIKEVKELLEFIGIVEEDSDEKQT